MLKYNFYAANFFNNSFIYELSSKKVEKKNKIRQKNKILL